MIMKHSRQRTAIIDFLQSRTDHPTAEVVYQHVKEDFPNISLGTVYRNLTQLSDMGMISRLHFSELTTDCFDPTTTAHQHFVCTSCHAVSDLGAGDSQSLIDVASKDFDGKIMNCNVYFSGLCKKCISADSNSLISQ